LEPRSALSTTTGPAARTNCSSPDIKAITATEACTRTACTSKPLRAKIPASLASQSGKTPAESETYEVVTLISCALAAIGSALSQPNARKAKSRVRIFIGRPHTR
jgi:hypothetical protein